MRSLFFTSKIGERVELTGEEGHHAADVVRVRAGEEIDVSDGSRLVHARVISVSKGRVEAEILDEEVISHLQPQITVAQALIKGDALGESVDLMTQVGVQHILFWQAERSVVQWDQSKADKNLKRFSTVALEASKQARRPIPPEIKGLVRTTNLIEIAAQFDRIILLHESGEEHLADDSFGDQRVLLVVGPEGGLSDQELAQIPGDVRRLGPTVIRSAQAGAIAASVLFAQRAWRKS